MLRKTWYVACLCLLLLSACSMGTSSQTSTATPAPGPESLQNLLQAEQLLLMTPHPLRNLYDIARRLKSPAPMPAAHTPGTARPRAIAGQEVSFWIHNRDNRRFSRISARLALITGHVYMYVEDGQPVNLNALQVAANTFESKIYPADRATFGSEWSPGIDGDVHVTVLNAIGLGSNVGGYFTGGDEYPTSINPYSNEREMFYVNLDGPIPGSAG